jgi:hypothetical protein
MHHLQRMNDMLSVKSGPLAVSQTSWTVENLTFDSEIRDCLGDDIRNPVSKHEIESSCKTMGGTKIRAQSSPRAACVPHVEASHATQIGKLKEHKSGLWRG